MGRSQNGVFERGKVCPAGGRQGRHEPHAMGPAGPVQACGVVRKGGSFRLWWQGLLSRLRPRAPRKCCRLHVGRWWQRWIPVALSCSTLYLLGGRTSNFLFPLAWYGQASSLLQTDQMGKAPPSLLQPFIQAIHRRTRTQKRVQTHAETLSSSRVSPLNLCREQCHAPQHKPVTV